LDAQAAFVAKPVARLMWLAKSARQVIDKPEVDVPVVEAAATSRRSSKRSYDAVAFVFTLAISTGLKARELRPFF
jgi:hypothetical protein